MKSVFEYDNYRLFLKDYYAAAKQRDRKFSFRFFSRMAGFKSGNNLKIVMDGKRNIAIHSIDKFTKALKLTKEEASFFKNLVLFNQARDLDDKQRFARELLRSRKYKEVFPLNEAQYNYFAYWFVVPIRELVTLPHAKEDPEWLARQLIPRITPQEAKKALELLLRAGLLVRNADGKLVQSHGHVTTGDEVTSTSIVQYHHEMMRRASESIERVPREKRDISSITMIMSPETQQKIKEMIQSFRKQVIETASQTNSPSAVYQLNFQFFPLAITEGGEKK